MVSPPVIQLMSTSGRVGEGPNVLPHWWMRAVSQAAAGVWCQVVQVQVGQVVIQRPPSWWTFTPPPAAELKRTPAVELRPRPFEHRGIPPGVLRLREGRAPPVQSRLALL